ncbi:MAG: hypothetical protein ACM3MD_01725 [Betaproteobacteria bacterium]
MTYSLFKGRVKDFTTWKESFDSVKMKRREAGITEKYVLRGVDDRNEVILLLEVKDIARAKAYYESPFLRDVMEKGGVIGRPEFRFFNDEYGDLAKVSGL